ncbi:hypothetical protein TIFTF001_035789 [Ficus carica]|uniref:Uncharacterized protein n=1 Tax=Ficus carica TaxID=3494 RepID=A0AA88JAG4_FICCA|nr:hypothetical protein TIFTF001_035789 [Ficus carica]
MGCARTCRPIFKARGKGPMVVYNQPDQIKPVKNPSLGTGLNDHHLRCTTPSLRGPLADHFQGPRHRSGQHFPDHYYTLPVLVASYCSRYVTLHWLITVPWHSIPPNAAWHLKHYLPLDLSLLQP